MERTMNGGMKGWMKGGPGMVDLLPLSVALLAGSVLGAFFFGGLWWTVRRVASSPRPAFLVFASLLLRTGVTLAGIYLAGGGDPARLAACLLGFTLARALLMRLARLPAACTPPEPSKPAAAAGDLPCA
jgi:F1F0 ATPase subunit 2